MADTRKAAVYCRVATTDDQAIEVQRRVVMAFACEYGYADVICYCDNGESGNGFDRPVLQRLNDDISAGKIVAVFAHSINRIGRDVAETIRYIETVKEKGVAVYTVIDGSFDGDNYRFLAKALGENDWRKSAKGGVSNGTEKP